MADIRRARRKGALTAMASIGRVTREVAISLCVPRLQELPGKSGYWNEHLQPIVSRISLYQELVPVKSCVLTHRASAGTAGSPLGRRRGERFEINGSGANGAVSSKRWLGGALHSSLSP